MSSLPWYLFHYSPPVGIAGRPSLLLLSPEGHLNNISLKELSKFEHPLVTHSFSLLVEWFRMEQLFLPEKILDLETAKKLIVGRPKSDFHHSRPWELWQLIKEHLPDRYEQEQIKIALSTHLAQPKMTEHSQLRWMATVAKALPKVWEKIQSELNEKGEAQRFINVEVPVYNLMLRSYLLGICVDSAKVNLFLNDLEKQYISAHYALSIRHGIKVDKALQDKQYLAECLDIKDSSLFESRSTREIISAFRNVEPKGNLFHVLLKTKRNKTILLRTFSVDSQYCYPVFDTIGTVTGRILVVDPQLQYLKKIYRSVVIPRDSKEFVYIDYSQFEPTIMANISNDPTLKEMCQNGDLYTQLSHQIFNTETHRSAAKTLFLAYSYGMEESGLSELIAKVREVGLDTATHILKQQFLHLFKGVEQWKSDVHLELEKSGSVGTGMGNYRYRTNSGKLTAQEKRWAVSQIIQGTGSLILKNLILKLEQALPTVNVLLPMHDALLLEVEKGAAVQLTKHVQSLFIDAFVEISKGIEPRVTVEPFAKTE